MFALLCRSFLYAILLCMQFTADLTISQEFIAEAAAGLKVHLFVWKMCPIFTLLTTEGISPNLWSWSSLPQERMDLDFWLLWFDLTCLFARSAMTTSWTPWKRFCSPTCRPQQPEALLSPPPWNWAHASRIMWSKKRFCRSQQTAAGYNQTRVVVVLFCINHKHTLIDEINPHWQVQSNTATHFSEFTVRWLDRVWMV